MQKATFVIRRNTMARGTVKGHIRGAINYMAIKLLIRECTNEPIKTIPEVNLAMVGYKFIM